MEAKRTRTAIRAARCRAVAHPGATISTAMEIEMNENNVERIAKILAEDHGDPQAWGAYASKAMQIIEIAQDDWLPIETAPDDVDFMAMDPSCSRDGTPYMQKCKKWADGSYLMVDEQCGWDLEANPTHWRPLPSPPSPPKKDRAGQ